MSADPDVFSMAAYECPNCGQPYDPRYMMYCARCGEAVPDERGKLPKPGPMDGMGARGGAAGRKSRGPTAPPEERAREPAEPWLPSEAVDDMVIEYRNRLNAEPDDHDARYSLALAYFYAGQWEKAEEQLLLVCNAMPQFADAHARLAVCLGRSGKLQEALTAAQAALALEPESPRFGRLVERLERAAQDAP